MQNVTTVNKEVDAWLLELESVMKKTLQKILARSLATLGKMTRDSWMFSFPGT